MLDLNKFSPVYIGAMGDTHGNARWTIRAVEDITKKLRSLGEPPPYFILQAGDFGAWNDRAGENFLQQVNLVLSAKAAVIAFVPGNHEDYNYIKSWVRDTPPKCPNIYMLPRGRRWVWHDRVWLALGGAVSPDKAVRTVGKDWFPQEEITHSQAADVCKEGHADVMLTHDAPEGVPLRYATPPPSFWAKEDLDRSERHRQLLRSVVTSVKAEYLIHGHYHQGSPTWREVVMPHGDMHIASLDMDGRKGNWGILNTKTMDWVL